MRKLNFLRKSERKSVGTTLALTVGSPSAHRRYSALKHLAFMLLFLLGSLNVWGAICGSIASSIAAGDEVVLVNTGGNAELTGVSSNVGQQAAYSDGTPAGTCILTVEAGKSGSGFSFRLSNGAYLAYTSTSTSGNNNLYTVSNPSTNDQKKQVSWTVSINASNEATITNVYNTNRKLRYNSGSPRFCCYTSGQQAVKFFKKSACSGPTVTPSTESLDFGTVAIGGTPSPATKTFSITGSDLTGNLSISADGGYTVSPTSVPASGTLSETNITVTPPSTATAGLKEGTITISGGGLSPDVTVSVSMLVEKTYDVNCALDFATIGSTGWSNSYQSHTVSKTGYEVVFAAASKQTGTITDIPVAKNTSVDLKLTDTNLATKYISAVKVVCRKWNTNSQTISLQYSVDGGETYTAFSPAVTSTTFTLEKLDLPAKVNALRFAASNNSQIGYASVHFDLVDKQTYTINKVETGCTLSVTNGTSAITSAEAGDEVYVSITETAEGYKDPVLSVKDAYDNTITVANGKFTMPAKAVTVTATATKKQYTVTLAATNGKIQVGDEDKTSIVVAHGETAELTAVANTDYAFNGWTSNSANVVLTDAAVNPATITVTGEGTITANFISTTKADPEISWSADLAEVVKGQTPYSLPSFSNPNELTVAYSSTDEGVAEISNAGVVTINGVGTTTIKATFTEDEDYAGKEVSYTLTVKGRVTWHIIKEGSDATSYADYEKDDVPTKPVGVTSCDASISLVGWTTGTYLKSDDAPTPLYTEDVPAVTDNADYYAVWGVSSADSEASISEGVNTGGIIDGNGWTNSGAGSYANHGLKFDTQGDNITSPNISSENLKSVVVKFRAGYNSQQNSGSVFTIYAYDSDDNVLDSKTCEPETDYDDQNDYSYTLSGSATIAYVKIALTTRVANVGMEYAELFKIIPGSTTGYTTDCVGPVVVTDPEFDVATGTYYEVKTVRISNHDDDYLYFYTLDGTDPAADSNLDPTGTSVAYNHTTGIAINESCTLKAIAYDIDGNHSEVVSAEYVINLPLTTIQGIFDEATVIGGTAQERVITFNNWVVSGVKDATAYITDGTKGFIIYTTSEGYHGLAVNDKISGTVTCQLKLFNKSAEVVGLTKADITAAGGSVTNDGVVTPVSKSIADLGGINTGAPVIISNVTYNSTNSTLVDEDENAIKPYTTLFNYGSTFVNNKIYSVTGIYLQYNNTKELLPRSADDIDLESKEQPTLKWYVNNTKEIEIGATYTINEDDVFAPYFESNSDGAKTYNSTVGTVASIDPSTGALTIEGVGETVISCAVEADGDYLAGSKSFTLKVRPEGSGDATWVAATWAAAEEVASNTKMSEKSPIAIDANLSMTWSKAEGSNDPIYHSDGEGRLYQKNTLTITASNSKQITRIEFHFTENNTGSISANEGYSNGVWTGFAPSVTFTNAQGASGARIQSIDIEYAQGTTTTLEISDIVLLNTDGETAISFTSNKPEAVVTYSDYDDEVITIADGKVTPVVIGNTTVKASIAAEAPYSSVSITFNVRVKSSTETVETVVILSQFGDKLLAMKHDFTAVEVERAADGSFVDLSVTEDEIKWTKTTDGSTAMFQQYGTNKYMAVGSSNALVLGDDATIWTLSGDGYYYNVSGRTFLYQGNGAKYKNYAAGNAGKASDGGYSQLASFVADPQFVTRDVLRDGLFDGKWGTYCPSKDVKYPAGASFYTLTYKEEVAGQPYKVFFDEVEPGAALVGGKPYLFIAEGEAIKGVKVGDAASLQNYNGFTGVLSDYTLDVTAGESAAYKYYIVYGNEIRLCGAGKFNVPAERAYLNMSQMSSTPVAQAPGRRRISLVNHAAETATGIENAEANEAPRKVLINGELYIIRGEKMYDAKGQLVK